DRMLTPRATAALVRVVHALCAAVMFFLAWQVWIKATRIAGYGDTTDVLRVPVGPFVYFMALMIGLTGAVHVLRVFVPGTLRASPATTSEPRGRSADRLAGHEGPRLPANPDRDF